MIRVRSISILLPLMLAFGTAGAQFSTGSDGSDGALTFEPSDTPVTIYFDPTSYDPPLDPEGDGIYHFTTITIPENVTVRLLSDPSGLGWRPLYWLATGDVVIDGTLDLRGQHGGIEPRTWPPPGGYPGGAPGGNNGLGPAGGTNSSRGGKHPGNLFLSPLTGGSGGYGTADSKFGGGGGGALLLASDTSITVNGSVTARGGNSGGGSTNNWSAGAEGALHILTPTFDGLGVITVLRGATGGLGSNNADDGWIRIEALQNLFTGTYGGGEERHSHVTLLPQPVMLPDTATYEARMARIGGIELPSPTTASFEIPDVVLDTAEPVAFEIEAANIPTGTIFHIILYNETLGPKGFETEPSEGSTQFSTAVGTTEVEHGYSSGFFYAWFPEPLP